MRDLIISLMNKVIVPKYSPMEFYVVSASDLAEGSTVGYLVRIEMNEYDSRKKDEERLVSEVIMILKMLGLKRVWRKYYEDDNGYDCETDTRYIRIIGIE